MLQQILNIIEQIKSLDTTLAVTLTVGLGFIAIIIALIVEGGQ